MTQSTGKEKNDPAVRVIGIFADEGKATRFIEQLVDEDFPMDQLSLLHRGGGLGDSPLGIVYTGAKERIKVWGEQGILWGALGGLLVGLSGLFLVPEVGAVLAAGPVVEALVGAIVGGTTMAGAAALTSMAAALRRIGIPEDKLTLLQHAIQAGHYVVLLHVGAARASKLAERLSLAGAKNTFEV